MVSPAENSGDRHPSLSASLALHFNDPNDFLALEEYLENHGELIPESPVDARLECTSDRAKEITRLIRNRMLGTATLDDREIPAYNEMGSDGGG